MLQGNVVPLIRGPDRAARIDRAGGGFADVTGGRLQRGGKRDRSQWPLRRLCRVGDDPARQGKGNDDASGQGQ